MNIINSIENQLPVKDIASNFLWYDTVRELSELVGEINYSIGLKGIINEQINFYIFLDKMSVIGLHVDSNISLFCYHERKNELKFENTLISTHQIKILADFIKTQINIYEALHVL